MTLPSAQDQELDVTVFGTSTAVNNRIIYTFTFPAVQQGYVWTGSINITPTLSEIANEDNNPTGQNDWEAFAQARYVLYRNGTPWLWWRGGNTVTDIRASSTDVISIVVSAPGAPLISGTGPNFQARWVGQSALQADSPFAWPYVAGPQPGMVAVYPAGGTVESPLNVLEIPAPSTVLFGEADNRLTSPIAAGSQSIFAAPLMGFHLWGLQLHASAASLSTVTGAQSWRVSVTGSVSGQTYAAINLDTVPGTSDADSFFIDFKGFKGSIGDGLQVNWTAFGGSVAAFSATAVYDAQTSY